MSYSSSTSSRRFAQEERLSLEEFHALIYTHILPIEQLYQGLQEAHAPFVSTRGISSFHCRKAIRLLLALNKELYKCCQFLRETQMLPIVMVALRYQLLDKLHYLKEQVDKLISYLHDLSSSHHSATLRHHVHVLFDNLLPLITDIPQHVIFLLDEARFHENRIEASKRNTIQIIGKNERLVRKIWTDPHD